MTIRSIGHWVLAAALLGPVGARAEASDEVRAEAQQHFRLGLELMQNENWSGALVEFTRSLELFPTRSALFNQANCLKAMHRYREAIAALQEWERRYAGQAPGEEAARVEGLRNELVRFVGELVVRVSVPGAEIRVDERPVGIAPLDGPVVAEVGLRVVEVVVPGHRPVRVEVAVVAGERTEVTLSPEPDAPLPPVGPPPVEPPPVEPPVLSPADGGGVHAGWFWGGVGLTVAAAVGAATAGGLAWDTHQDYVGGGRSDPALADRGGDLELAANVLVGVAAAAAAATLILGFFTDFGGDTDETPPGPDAALAVRLAPGGLEVLW